jgi:predicted nucleotidyltransferase
MDKNCIWPDLPERFDRALREAVAYILDRFQVRGIVAAGSILRGAPDPSSDLDLYVVQSEPWRQRLQRIFHGVPAEIFVNPEKAIEGYFESEPKSGRPMTAHMIAAGHVVLDRDGVVAELRQKAAAIIEQPVFSEEALTYQRYMVAASYEDAMDKAESDPATAGMIMARTVEEMLEYHFLEKGCYLPRRKDLLSELPPGLQEDARAFFGEGDIARRLELAGRIADATIEARGFFEWESAPDPIQ